MSKKDYIAIAIAIADALRESRPLVYGSANGQQWMQDVEAIRSVLARNPTFNSARWMGYVNGANGPSGGKR